MLPSTMVIAEELGEYGNKVNKEIDWPQIARVHESEFSGEPSMFAHTWNAKFLSLDL